MIRPRADRVASELVWSGQFIERFAPQYLTEGEVDYDRVREALEGRRAGCGGIFHAFDEVGGSTLTGLSYQTSVEEMLDAVVSGIAGRLLRDVPDVERAASLLVELDHSLSDLLVARMRDHNDSELLSGTLTLVSNLREGVL